MATLLGIVLFIAFVRWLFRSLIGILPENVQRTISKGVNFLMAIIVIIVIAGFVEAFSGMLH